ncbi:MAG: GspH/FimT family pseudopilin [Parvularcula sp.]|jgi:general secretion pathway protein H|nr:GspH/FimT family pseudopilin [Parvularcula sp.]
MRISAPGRSDQGGLTLVELLIVMVIVGMTAGMVMLAAPRGETDLRRAAVELERELASLRDGALYAGRVYGMGFEEKGVVTYEPGGEGWRERSVLDFGGTVSFKASPGEGLVLPEHEDEIAFGRPLSEDEKEAPSEPTILFLPDGGATPAEIELRSAEGAIVITLDAQGRLGRKSGDE